MSGERDVLFASVTKDASPKERAMAEKRLGYNMPPGYISKKDLVLMDLACANLCTQLKSKFLSIDWNFIPEDFYTSVVFSKCFGTWSNSGSPVYCITKEIMEPLNQTDSLSKKAILKDFNLPLYNLLIAVPRNKMCTPTGNNTYVDFLLVNCFYPTEERLTKLIGVFSVDTDGNTWVVKTEIDLAGNVIVDERESEKHKDFFHKIRNLVISVLLLMDVSGDSILTDVAPSETVEGRNHKKGFGKSRVELLAKYPRWIGKNYQQKTERQQVARTKGSHSSPRTHWRRGHFRRLEPGEGKKWTAQQTLWIEPVLINVGVE
jgi:hypothetical protein